MTQNLNILATSVATLFNEYLHPLAFSLKVQGFTQLEISCSEGRLPLPFVFLGQLLQQLLIGWLQPEGQPLS